MPSLRDIKKRIQSVKNTGKITKAMKMVAAAKLRKAQDNMLKARPYSDKMASILSALVTGVDREAHPLLMIRPRNMVSGSAETTMPSSAMLAITQVGWTNSTTGVVPSATSPATAPETNCCPKASCAGAPGLTIRA